MIITHESAQAILNKWKNAGAKVIGNLAIAPKESSTIEFTGTVLEVGEKLKIRCDSEVLSLAMLPSTVDYSRDLASADSTGGHTSRIQIVALVWRCQIYGPQVDSLD